MQRYVPAVKHWYQVVGRLLAEPFFGTIGPEGDLFSLRAGPAWEGATCFDSARSALLRRIAYEAGMYTVRRLSGCLSDLRPLPPGGILPKGETSAYGAAGRLGGGRDALALEDDPQAFPAVRGLRAVRPPVCPQALHQRAAGRFAVAASPLDPVCLGYLDSAGWPALAACRTHRLVAFPAGLFVAGNRPRPIATGDRRAVGTDQACRAGGGGDARGCVRRMHGAQRPPRLDCAG